jgi:hypothetical protein
VHIARALAELGEHTDARDLLEREAPHVVGGMRPVAVFELAKLHWRRRSGRARALAEAAEAATLFAEAEANGRSLESRAEVEAWLRSHRR